MTLPVKKSFVLREVKTVVTARDFRVIGEDNRGTVVIMEKRVWDFNLDN